MPYKLIEFDGVDLPLFDAAQDVGVAPVESTLLDSVGGVFDYYGTRRRRARRYPIRAAGVILGETQYVVDEGGNPTVDEAGNYQVTGTAATDLRSKAQALRAKIGTRASLWRQRLDDTATVEWITARLLQVNHPRKIEEHDIIANAECVFESYMDAWHAESATVSSVSVTDAVEATLNVAVGGDMPVHDAVITVTRTSGTITQFEFDIDAIGVALEWTGSLGAGEVLTIDAGNKTVLKGTANAYSGFAFGAGHTAKGWFWLPIPAGTVVCKARTTGGNATVAVTHYNQFA